MTIATVREFVQYSKATKRNGRENALRNASVGEAPQRPALRFNPLVVVLLHWAPVEHVEHARISRAAPCSIIAHEVVDAHAWPRASSLCCGRRRSAIAARWWGL